MRAVLAARPNRDDVREMVTILAGSVYRSSVRATDANTRRSDRTRRNGISTPPATARERSVAAVGRPFWSAGPAAKSVWLDADAKNVGCQRSYAYPRSQSGMAESDVTASAGASTNQVAVREYAWRPSTSTP